MKRIVIITMVFLFVATAVLAETVTVITKENTIREYNKFFSPVKAYVKYNDKLEVLSINGDWYKVKFGPSIGYIHKTAVEKRTASSPGLFSRKGSGVSESEAALAGKGFNPQVEASYKSKHPEMKFYLVDNIERFIVPDREVTVFIANGGLVQP